MTIQIILTVALVFLAGFFNGVCDTLQFHFDQSFAKDKNPFFWDPIKSWRNKYKDQDPKKGPKFPGSTTFLVLFTDAWHLFKFAYMASLRLSVVIWMPFEWYIVVACYLFLWGVQAMSFHIPYTIMKSK